MNNTKVDVAFQMTGCVSSLRNKENEKSVGVDPKCTGSFFCVSPIFSSVVIYVCVGFPREVQIKLELSLTINASSS